MGILHQLFEFPLQVSAALRNFKQELALIPTLSLPTAKDEIKANETFLGDTFYTFLKILRDPWELPNHVLISFWFMKELAHRGFQIITSAPNFKAFWMQRTNCCNEQSRQVSKLFYFEGYSDSQHTFRTYKYINYKMSTIIIYLK